MRKTLQQVVDLEDPVRAVRAQHDKIQKSIYAFEEGDKDMRDLLGGKGANLAEMTNLGLPVPPGFTITTEVCEYFLKQANYPENFDKAITEKLQQLEEKLGKKFGDPQNPLLVSVRSGAQASMPGMMDTILNLGLNDETVMGLAKKTNNERFAYDAYRRFINMFGDVVLGVNHEFFEGEMDRIKHEKGVKLDTELDASDLKKLVEAYKSVVKKHAGVVFPHDPREQLRLSVEAVFKSWNNERAVVYRRLHRVTGLKGTAVNVQSMVFGNMGMTSGTGVCFTRNPAIGGKEFYGEFLINAQGEDVVAGIRTPQPILALRGVLPEVYEQLIRTKDLLEKHYKDMQDIEFTVENRRLFILQTRNGKRTAQAAVKIAVDLVSEGLLTKKEAILKVDPHQLDHLLHPQLDPKAPKNVVARGLPASPGAASGKVVFSADDAYAWVEEKQEKVILVRKETMPEDIHGMAVAKGILTACGGLTSHAAVVARGMGKPCVAGCADIVVDKKHRKILVGDLEIQEGEIITIDGSKGEVIIGAVPMIEPQVTGDFKTVMQWADQIRKLKVRANADTPRDAKVGRDFGAEGIGLCRTEHMFFAEDRIPAVREMILAKTTEGRKKALDKLLPMQREDFTGIFTAMDGLPVTIRLLDPPLHEFLPDTDKKIQALADQMSVTFEELKNVVESLHEVNPMLGHRGCRLGVSYPEIYEMQVRAIVEAALAASKNGVKVIAEIEIPLVANVNELRMLRELTERVIDEYRLHEHGHAGKLPFDYSIGTMIELPRACLTANQIADYADFFSFGTNDLTQTTYGFSRDDVGKFINTYIEKGIIERDPSETIDQAGVGELMRIGVELGRSVKPNINIGICGEHGGDPESVEFCHRIGLNYVSCSPFRVPIARLAAAQAVVKESFRNS